jgi:hypothetical protein
MLKIININSKMSETLVTLKEDLLLMIFNMLGIQEVNEFKIVSKKL